MLSVLLVLSSCPKFLHYFSTLLKPVGPSQSSKSTSLRSFDMLLVSLLFLYSVSGSGEHLFILSL